MDDRWQDDEQVLAELGEALRAADDVPARIVALGEAAYAWRSVDAQLATLTYDSAAEPATAHPALVRAETVPVRSLRFQAGAAAIVLEVNDDALVGQILPPRPAGISLMSSEGRTLDVEADGLGYFVFRPVPRGLFRLLCRGGSEPELLTSEFRL
jgi:hypothetical protein